MSNDNGSYVLPPAAAAPREIDYHAVPGQILISGTETDIDELIGHLIADGYGPPSQNPPTLIWQINEILSNDDAAYTIRLYEFEPGPYGPHNPWVIMRRANELSRANGPLFAIAECNEVIWGLTHVTGHTINGGPGGPPFRPTKNFPQNDDRPYFREQWIFQSYPGINLLEGPRYRRRDQLGAGVQVAIFDSSPVNTGLYDEMVTTAGHPFSMSVQSALDDAHSLGIVRTDEAEHGYFAASLVQAVAPECQIDLVQVLDSELRGSIGFLIPAIDNYFIYFDGGERNRLIVNLSLSFDLNMHATLEFRYHEMAVTVLEAHGRMKQLISELLAPSDGSISPEMEKVLAPVLEMEIPRFSFPLFLSSLRTRYPNFEHLVVAAAGNERTQSDLAPLPPTMPASLPSVLGVAASGHKGAPAVFGNEGDVMAPGGDFGTVPLDAADPFASGVTWLEDLSRMCDIDPRSCVNGVVARVTTPTANTSMPITVSGPGYMIWWGSSFSAPLASGLAALVWSKDPSLSADQVKGVIVRTANKRVIDVQAALNEV